MDLVRLGARAVGSEGQIPVFGRPPGPPHGEMTLIPYEEACVRDDETTLIPYEEACVRDDETCSFYSERMQVPYEEACVSDDEKCNHCGEALAIWHCQKCEALCNKCWNDHRPHRRGVPGHAKISYQAL